MNNIIHVLPCSGKRTTADRQNAPRRSGRTYETLRCLCLIIACGIAGCSQSIVVTKQGEQFSNTRISCEQFNRLRSGKYFDMVLADSTMIPITFIRTESDSIRFETGDLHQRHTLPLGSVSMLIYRQNDNGFNSMIGAFAGLFLSGAITRALFDFNNNASSIEGFAMVIGGTAGGALIGYYNETTSTYTFQSTKATP